MKVLFILKTGATIEWLVPEDAQPGFRFDTFCGNIRIVDFFQGLNMHIKYEDICAILHSTDDVTAPVFKGTLQ